MVPGGTLRRAVPTLLAPTLMSTTSPNTLLTASGIAMHYGNRPALTDVSFSVGSGETIGLLGPKDLAAVDQALRFVLDL